MKIQISTDDGKTINFDSDALGVGISAAERTVLTNALHEAGQVLSQDHAVIASIKGDIQAVVSRIETELGAHPAFTWAQTKLKNAASDLEAYVKGIWIEPGQPAGDQHTTPAS